MNSVIILSTVIALIVVFLKHPLFGQHPSGARRKRIMGSPNFKNGQFQNLLPTPQLTDGYTFGKVLWKFLFQKKEATKPNTSIPSISIDFKNLDRSKDAYYWLGHSSYFLILDQKIYLIDPVFTKNGAPVLRSNIAFEGTTFIDMNQLPEIDYLIITHDHFDHLDYTTIKTIRPKIKEVICGLGVGSHFELWGYATNKITELDWWDEKQLNSNQKITATPARHFSGRTFFHKNNTLFCSYVLETSNNRIFIGGDSGYGPHFKEIGQKFAPFDLAFIENGQYNVAWHYIHLHPEEIPKVIEDLQLKTIVPVHHSKFALSDHPWKKPLEDAIAHRSNEIDIHTPLIGERVIIGEAKTWTKWWKDID